MGIFMHLIGPSEFCLGKWKTYKLKEVLQLNANLASSYDGAKQYDIINETLFLAQTTYPHSYMIVKLVKIDFRSGIASEFFTSAYPYPFASLNYLTTIQLDKNGFIYVFVQTDDKSQMLKFDAKLPHNQIMAKVIQIGSFNNYNNFVYDAQIDKIFLISSLNFLMVNT